MTAFTEAKWAGRAQGALAVVALVAVAQIWPGWQLDSAANKEIAAAHTSGYILAQAPVCAAQFMAQPNADEKLAELDGARGVTAQVDFIPAAYRTLPGEERVNFTLGRECLKSIRALSDPAESAQM